MPLYLDPSGRLFLGDNCNLPACEDGCPGGDAGGDAGCGGDNCFTFDCPGGTDECPWGTPPFGDCGGCVAGTTPSLVLLRVDGVELSTRLTNPAQEAFWENYFNTTTFECEQISACTFKCVDNSPDADVYQTLDVRSVVASVFLTSIPWALAITITLYNGDNGTGTSTVVLNVFSATAAHGTANFPAGYLCDEMPPTIDHFHINGAQDWSTIPGFSLTLMPYGSDTVEA